ncbi:MAG: beta-glucuronidase [Croceitalea sp.]|nr:beta galactosidase jelly roll domain-containing protein [Croceitalea sp.]MBT8238617.1 beta galactosidase jelly roll domain-containing protein [Croceitalea sp.]NNL09257.1 beta-glucuronidase [Croceitalea sp.]NNM19040.1 beta-glucuronidase [Croceitalea sp.]
MNTRTSCFKALFLIFFVTSVTAQYEVPVPQNTYSRAQISLNGNWDYFVDRYEAFFYDFVRVPFDSVGGGRLDFAALDGKAKNKTDRYEYAFDGAKKIAVPGDWNSQSDRLFYYEGSVWYRTLFDAPQMEKMGKLLLHFGAVNYRADVYVNGKKAGVHEGGFTPFAFNIANLIHKGQNSLVVRVDNKRNRSAVPTDVTDWWNYGGITRDVTLIPMPDSYIEQYQIQLDKENAKQITGFVKMNQGDAEVTIECKELGLSIKIETKDGKPMPFTVSIRKKIEKWSPEHPKLYDFTISSDADSIDDKIGLRTITTKGNQLLLNDIPIFLRGISVHEENPIKGRRNHNKADALQIFDWVKQLNANYVRLAHYPHNEYMPRMADSLGILLWEEIPVYWTIDWKNEATYQNAEQQLTELISRDRNRSSVIIWSMANETPDIPERLVFLKKLAAKAREMDQSRLLSAALFKANLGDGNYTISDPFGQFTDLVSFNQYLGWYEGTPDILDAANFTFKQNKPVIVSEFGAGAKAGFHADQMTRWSEEYQNYLYQETLELMDRMPNLVGFSPWILADFRSPRRQLPGIQDEWNRKGLVGQNGKFKKAFNTLKDYYSKKMKMEK